MSFLAVIVTTLIAVGVFSRTPYLQTTRGLVSAMRRSGHCVASHRISDHWKEKALARYSLTIAQNSLSLLLCFVALLATVLAAHLVFSLIGVDLIAALTSPEGVALSLVTATAQVVAVRTFKSNPASPYSPIEQTLHRIVLGIPALNRALLEQEIGALDGAKAAGSTRPVFIAGLARSGTTAMMRALFDTGQFASLTYADMPFVLAPSLWAKLRGGVKVTASREREHGDGIHVNEASPEAFEEVFWKTLDGNAYISHDMLTAHRPPKSVIDRFIAYTGAVCRQGGKTRYLSKNNNNILRLGSLTAAFPDARIVVPFRDPLQHAASLLSQHKRFCLRQQDDPFVRKYMGWLGHFEFGLDHRRIELGTGDPAKPGVASSPNRVGYWLEEWVEVYQHVLTQKLHNPDRIILIGYESLCRQPEDSWAALCDELDLGDASLPGFAEAPARQVDRSGIDRNTLRRAAKLYRDLASASLNPATDRYDGLAR